MISHHASADGSLPHRKSVGHAFIIYSTISPPIVSERPGSARHLKRYHFISSFGIFLRSSFGISSYGSFLIRSFGIFLISSLDIFRINSYGSFLI